MGKPKTPEESFKDRSEMLEINWDEEFAKLEKLSAEELEQLNADFDPENSLLPIQDRTSYVCEKKPGRMYERDVLLDHLEEFAKKSTIGSDYLPYVKKEKPPSKWDKKEEPEAIKKGFEIRSSNNNNNTDDVDLSKLTKEESEALNKATEQELVEAAAQMGMNSFLTQEQVHSVKSGNKPDVIEVTKASKYRKPVKPPEESDKYLDLEILSKEILKDDPEVIAIALSNINYLDVSVHEKIAECLTKNTTLKFLSLANSNINDYAVRFYADALLRNKTLESINLESNYITPIGMGPLLNSLIQNTTLREALLENQRCKLGQKCELDIANALKENQSILNFGLSFETAGPRGTVSNMLLRNNDRLREARKRGETAYKLPDARRAAVAYLNKVGVPPWIKQKAELPNKMMLQAGIKNLKRVPSGQRSPRVASPERKRTDEEIEEEARRAKAMENGEVNEDDSGRRRRRRGRGEDDDETDGGKNDRSRRGGSMDPFDDDKDMRKRKVSEERRLPIIAVEQPRGMEPMSRRKKEPSPIFDDDNMNDLFSGLPEAGQEKEEQDTEEIKAKEEEGKEEEEEESSRPRRRNRRQENEEDDEEDSSRKERGGRGKDPFDDEEEARKKKNDKEGPRTPVVTLPEPQGMQPMSRRRKERTPEDEEEDINSLLESVAQETQEKEAEKGDGRLRRGEEMENEEEHEDEDRTSRRRRGRKTDEEEESTENGEGEQRRSKGKDPFDDENEQKATKSKESAKGILLTQETGAMEPARRRKKGGARDEEEDINSLLDGVPSTVSESKEKRRGGSMDPFEDEGDAKKARVPEKKAEPIVNLEPRAMEPARRRRRGDLVEEEEGIDSLLSGVPKVEDDESKGADGSSRKGKDPFEEDDKKMKKEENTKGTPVVSLEPSGMGPAQRRRRGGAPEEEEEEDLFKGVPQVSKEDTAAQDQDSKGPGKDPFEDDDVTSKKTEEKKRGQPIVSLEPASMEPARRRRRGGAPEEEEEEDLFKGVPQVSKEDTAAQDQDSKGPGKDPFEDDDVTSKKTEEKKRGQPIVSLEPASMEPARRRRRGGAPEEEEEEDLFKGVPQVSKEDTAAQDQDSKGPGKDPFEDDDVTSKKTEEKKRGQPIVSLEPASMEPARRRRRGGAPGEEEEEDLFKGVPQVSKEEVEEEKKISRQGKDPFEDDKTAVEKKEETKKPTIPVIQQPTRSMEPARRRRRGGSPEDEAENLDSLLSSMTTKEPAEGQEEVKKEPVKDPFEEEERRKGKGEEPKKTVIPVQEPGEGLAPARRRRRDRVEDEGENAAIQEKKEENEEAGDTLRRRTRGRVDDEENEKSERNERRRRARDREEKEVEKGTPGTIGPVKDPFDDENETRKTPARKERSPEMTLPEPAGLGPAQRRRRERVPVDDEAPSLPATLELTVEEAPKVKAEEKILQDPKSEEKPKDPFDDDKNIVSTSRKEKEDKEEKTKPQMNVQEPRGLEPATRRRRNRTEVEEEINFEALKIETTEKVTEEMVQENSVEEVIEDSTTLRRRRTRESSPGEVEEDQSSRRDQRRREGVEEAAGNDSALPRRRGRRRGEDDETESINKAEVDSRISRQGAQEELQEEEGSSRRNRRAQSFDNEDDESEASRSAFRERRRQQEVNTPRRRERRER